MTLLQAGAAAPPGLRMLDHVALRVQDRAGCAAELLEALDVQVIDRTESFTLIGPDFASGKITLLDAEQGTTPAPISIVSLVFASGPGRPAAAPIILDCGLVLTFHAGDEDERASVTHAHRHALVGIVLRSDDPPITAALLAAEFGLRPESVGADVASLSFGDGATSGRLTLVRERDGGRPDEAPCTPMLDHVGVRITDAGAWRSHAERSGLRVDRWVEASRTNAVFVEGPESLLVEYVEHLPTAVDA